MIDVPIILLQDRAAASNIVGLFPEVVKMAGTLPGNGESIVWNLIRRLGLRQTRRSRFDDITLSERPLASFSW